MKIDDFVLLPVSMSSVNGSPFFEWNVRIIVYYPFNQPFLVSDRDKTFSEFIHDHNILFTILIAMEAFVAWVSAPTFSRVLG